MSAGFTPGPWYASAPYAGFASIKQVETDALIFGIAAGDPDEKQSDATCEANANLIAAAPELYRVLDNAVRQYDAVKGGPIFGALEAARAVLAKVRGEQVHSDPLPKEVGR